MSDVRVRLIPPPTPFLKIFPFGNFCWVTIGRLYFQSRSSVNLFRKESAFSSDLLYLYVFVGSTFVPSVCQAFLFSSFRPFKLLRWGFISEDGAWLFQRMLGHGSCSMVSIYLYRNLQEKKQGNSETIHTLKYKWWISIFIRPHIFFLKLPANWIIGGSVGGGGKNGKPLGAHSNGLAW